MGAIKLQLASDDRYLSQDPIGFDGGDYNLYRFVVNAPLTTTDPSGECPLCAAVGIGAFVGAVANLAGSAAAGTLTQSNFFSTAAIGAAAGATAVLTSGAVAAAGAVTTAGELFGASLSSGFTATAAGTFVDLTANAFLNSPPTGTTAENIANGLTPPTVPDDAPQTSPSSAASQSAAPPTACGAGQ